MSSWKKSFEGVLWKSRFVVILAVITSVLAGLDLFFVVGLESFRVLVSLAHSADLSLAVDQRDRLLREHLTDDLADRWLFTGRIHVHLWFWTVRAVSGRSSGSQGISDVRQNSPDQIAGRPQNPTGKSDTDH